MRIFLLVARSAAKFSVRFSLIYRFIFGGVVLALLLMLSYGYILHYTLRDTAVLKGQHVALERLVGQLGVWFDGLPGQGRFGGIDGKIIKRVAFSFDLNESDPRLSQLMATLERLERHKDSSIFESKYVSHVVFSQSVLKRIQEEAQRARILANPEIGPAARLVFILLPGLLENLSKQFAVLIEGRGRRDQLIVGLKYVILEDLVRMEECLKKLSASGVLGESLRDLAKDFSKQVRRSQADLDAGQNADFSSLLQKGMELIFELRSLSAVKVDEQIKINQAVGGGLLAVLLLLSGLIFYVSLGTSLGIMRSVASIEAGSKAFRSGQLGKRIELKSADEFLVIAQNFNGLADDFNALLKMQRKQSEISQAELEKKVELRTAELALANAELSKVIAVLNRTRNEVVEREKMAALGALVAGVAHEVSTPVGLAYTAVTHMQDCMVRLVSLSKSNVLDKIALDESCSILSTTMCYVIKSLERASVLIESFKQVSVDRSSDVVRDFDLETVLLEVSRTLSPVLQQGDFRIVIEKFPAIVMCSFAGALGQVISNVVLNAVKHGFEERNEGEIRIRAKLLDAATCQISILDNGVGMAPDVVPHVFEPFFTTKRGRGGSGLGLHIAWNLVTQSLGGNISCASQQGEGCVITLTLPLRLSTSSAP